jgi:hypothetical protein
VLQVYTGQGCQTVCFQTKNPNLGKFWRVLQWKMMVYFMNTWSILWTLGIVRGNLVYTYFPFWYFVPRKILQPWYRAVAVHHDRMRWLLVGKRSKSDLPTYAPPYPWMIIHSRVARFCMVQTYQNVINVPYDHNLNQTAINYTKWP